MPKLLLPFSILPLLLFHVISQSLDAERSILLDLKLQWGNPPSIQSWDDSSSPCYWQGIICTHDTVTEIHLYGEDFTRKIPAKICDLKNLTVLHLSSNSIPGEFPDILNCSKLQLLDLSRNYFTGPIPPDIDRIRSLEYLDLSANNFSGELPKSLGNCSKLQRFDLSQNYFMGPIPPDIDRIRSLEYLDLSANNFSGELPKSLGNCTRLEDVQLSSNGFWGEIPWGLVTSASLNSLRVSDNFFSGEFPTKLGQNLGFVDISDNRFSGPIPAGISAVMLFELTASNNLFSGEIPAALMNLPRIRTLLLDRNQFSGHLPSVIINSYSHTLIKVSRNKLSGPIPKLITPLDYIDLDFIYLDFSENQFSGHIPPEIGRLRPVFLNLSSNQLSGEVPPYLQSRKFKYSFLNNSNLCADNPILNLPTCSSKLSTKYLALILVFSSSAFLVIVFFASCMIRKCQRSKHIHCIETWELIAFQRLDFTESDVLSCLAENNIIGSGGSGQVYRIAINHSCEFVAVKRIWKNRTPDGRFEKQFIAEVQILGTIRHFNIVKLLCCISSESSKLLVYEYVKNESLDRWLHGKNRTSSLMSSSSDNIMLDWPTRLHIAIGAARGLCYMHHDCSPPIIHRDVKSSNILLDAEFNAKMADFGLAKMLNKEGDPETMSAIAGSFGYIAPEYAYTRKANEKIDVYSFGVVLLELATGREANRGNEHMSLQNGHGSTLEKESPLRKPWMRGSWNSAT